jgi:hypothetical protein
MTDLPLQRQAEATGSTPTGVGSGARGSPTPAAGPASAARLRPRPPAPTSRARPQNLARRPPTQDSGPIPPRPDPRETHPAYSLLEESQAPGRRHLRHPLLDMDLCRRSVFSFFCKILHSSSLALFYFTDIWRASFSRPFDWNRWALGICRLQSPETYAAAWNGAPEPGSAVLPTRAAVETWCVSSFFLCRWGVQTPEADVYYFGWPILGTGTASVASTQHAKPSPMRHPSGTSKAKYVPSDPSASLNLGGPVLPASFRRPPMSIGSPLSGKGATPYP